MARLNWKRVNDKRRISEHGFEYINDTHDESEEGAPPSIAEIKIEQTLPICKSPQGKHQLKIRRQKKTNCNAHTHTNRIKCNYCEKEVKTYESLDRHVSIKHADHWRSYSNSHRVRERLKNLVRCVKCGTLLKKSSIESHKKRCLGHHDKNKSHLTTISTSSCDCISTPSKSSELSISSQSLSTPSQKDINTQRQTDKFKCPYCSKQMAEELHVDRHVASKHGDKWHEYMSHHAVKIRLIDFFRCTKCGVLVKKDKKERHSRRCSAMQQKLKKPVSLTK